MKKTGFTLIEMVVTITVVSVMFLAIAGFLELGTKGYADSAKRQALQNQARFAIEKVSREVRHAVPNSFEVTEAGKCLTFHPILYSGFYRVDAAVSGAAEQVRFVLGNSDADLSAVSQAARIVINPSIISDFETSSSASVPTSDATVSGSVYTIVHSFPSYSIGSRHYIYQPAQKVNYCLDTSANVQSLYVCRNGVDGATCLASNSKTKVSENIASGQFRYDNASLIRGGLIHMQLQFRNGDELSDYQHEVQVLNVP
ncbi:prepilin-type N-terminal cleavage/methylation domain-containing protein [Vibrio sp. SCSIO 43136]|uniref:PulJ/GspJ family protein n=1 Tax=Vibrio sp. SCSIO 43136 TaxID=2819101 RepID=UPI00207660C7|nr:prepilin-type N-terminal cleavage/methylation domain-containing protein [Vibrio sp. SCSIO 43136]USD65014.1 prepilin-type N-terminal cleavage/methylation domain-containing protein [Vibrio sp. SCSIO 43136]